MHSSTRVQRRRAGDREAVDSAGKPAAHGFWPHYSTHIFSRWTSVGVAIKHPTGLVDIFTTLVSRAWKKGRPQISYFLGFARILPVPQRLFRKRPGFCVTYLPSPALLSWRQAGQCAIREGIYVVRIFLRTPLNRAKSGERGVIRSLSLQVRGFRLQERPVANLCSQLL